MIKDLQGKNADEIKALKAAHEALLHETNARSDANLKNLMSENKSLSDQLSDCREIIDKMKVEMELVSNSAARDVLSRISEFERQKLADLNDKKADFDRQLAEMTKHIESLLQQIEALKQDHIREMAAAGEEFNKKKVAWRQEHRTKLEHALAAERAKFADKDERIQQLLAQIDELREKFNTRDPRPEDLAQIEFLEGDLKEKTDTIGKLFNQLKHYQNELVNRESAYNKLFSANPNVGVLNVIERKVKRDNLVAESSTTPRNLPPLLELPESSPSRPTSVRRRQNSSAKPERATPPRKQTP
jgi:hypothetical protein